MHYSQAQVISNLNLCQGKVKYLPSDQLPAAQSYVEVERHHSQSAARIKTRNAGEKVAFFQTIGASTIAEVARLLRPRDYAAGAVIVRRGEPGDCMYFVASGEVEIEIDPEPFRLDIAEFRELRSRQPDLARVIYDAAHRRLGAVGAERTRERETVGEFSASC